ncbi:TIGR03564 family F420-dependent LLM class oxidoreductase [Lentzea sp. NPDC055074]
MSIGVTLNAESTAANQVDAIVALARSAATAGVRSVWLGQRLDYDAAALATVVGREVPGVHVGTSAIPVFGRHPVLVSSLAQTAQAATHGRFQLGLGLGAKAVVEPAFGVPHERPVALLREFLSALRPLLHDGVADFHGERITAAPTRPVRVAGADPAVPVLVAAMGPRALEVAGELADGTLPYLATPRVLGEHVVPAITKAAEQAGRPAPRIVALITATVTSDVDGVREKAARALAFYDEVPSYQRVLGLGGVAHAHEIAVIGDEKQLDAAVRRHLDAGATEVVLNHTNLGGPADQQRTFEAAGGL